MIICKLNWLNCYFFKKIIYFNERKKIEHKADEPIKNFKLVLKYNIFINIHPQLNFYLRVNINPA